MANGDIVVLINRTLSKAVSPCRSLERDRYGANDTSHNPLHSMFYFVRTGIVQGKVYAGNYPDDLGTVSALPSSAWLLRIDLYAKDALESFLRAGFGTTNNATTSM